MSRKIVQKRQKTFIKKVIEFLTKLEAQSITPEIDGWIAQFTIITRIGLLQITLPKEHDNLFTVFCKFMDKEKYSIFNSVRVNKYSGKWNFHSVDEDFCFDQFESELNSIVIDQYTTDVIFRKWKGEIIALLPHEVCDRSGSVTSYMHVGQHSGANYSHIVRNSTLATEEEYSDLKKEMEHIGYNIRIVKKQQYGRYIKDFNKVRGN